MPAFDQVRLGSTRVQPGPLANPCADAQMAIHADPRVTRDSNLPRWTSIDRAHALIERDPTGLSAGKHLCLGAYFRALQPVISGDRSRRFSENVVAVSGDRSRRFTLIVVDRGARE